ncbi:hypothetical protein BDN71DRAFT_1509021 [Pleurotus eryngii]|uniref:Uncharacterized protein n=1 Tax=Pleurotus eryngii TaxID=5323 RepID=A0A9P5ZTK0_PLEER|nr:hypothetical protein BDN71DRAFT_1509021 [Pleurotus eryngii]
MPPHVLKDKTAMNKITLLGVKMVEEIASMNERTDDRNPQTIFKKFKDQVITTVWDRARVLVPMLEAKIKKLEAQLVSEMNKEEANRDQNVAAATIEEKIQILEERRHQQVRYTTAAMNRIHGETVSKYWTALNKAKTPRDTILGLRNCDGSGRILKDPKKMASLARKYHNDIQWEDLTPQAPTERKKNIDEALREVKCKLNPDQANFMSKRLTREEVAFALAHAETGKAAGINGIPYELWKALDQQFIDEKE